MRYLDNAVLSLVILIAVTVKNKLFKMYLCIFKNTLGSMLCCIMQCVLATNDKCSAGHCGVETMDYKHS